MARGSHNQHEASSSGAADDPTYQSSESSSPENEDSMPRRKGREMARGFYVSRRLKEGGRIGGVIIKPDQYVATGPSEKTFKMETGIITKELAPFHLLNWRALKKEEHKNEKTLLFDKLQSEFQINVDDPHVREVVDSTFGKRFRSIKNRGHKHYLKFDDKEEALANPMQGISPAKWAALCEHFESEKFKRASAAGKRNRSKVKVNHSCGQKSICQRIYEMENKEDLAQEDQEAQEPIELRVYYETHTKNGVWINPEAEHNYEQMKNLYTKSLENGDGLTGRQIIEEVAKPKTSYVRGLGYGFRSSTAVRAPREVDDPINSGLREELENKIAEQQAEMQAQKAEMEAKMQAQKAEMEAEMRAQKDQMDKMKSAFEKFMRKAEKKKKKKKKRVV